MKKQFLLGLMAMTLPLTTWAQEFVVTLENANATLKGDKYEIPYQGGVVDPQVKVAWKTSTGTTTTLTEGEDYTVSYSFQKNSGGAPTTTNVSIENVGTYTVTIKGIETYEGRDNGTATFSITPVTVTKLTIADAGVKKTYGTPDGEIKLEDYITTVTTLVGDDKIVDFAKCVKLVRVADDGAETTDTRVVGNYRARVVDNENPDNNYVYNPGTSTSQEFNLKIEPKALTAEFEALTYKGENFDLAQLLKEEGAYTLKTPAYDDEVTITKLEGATVKDAKTYSSLKATLSDTKNYTIGDVTLVVNKADLNITITEENKANLNKVYGKEDPELTTLFTFKRGETELKQNEAEFKSLNLTMQREEGENVLAEKDGEMVTAEYAITPSIQTTTNYNIVYTGGDVFTIKPKTLGKGSVDKDITFALQNAEELKKLLTYTGEDFITNTELTDNLYTLEYTEKEVESVKKDLVYGTDYTITVFTNTEAQNKKAINAGDNFLMTFFGKGNYEGYVWSQTFTIGKATLEIAAKEESEDVKWSRTYNGIERQDVLTDHYTYTFGDKELTLEEVEDMGLTMKRRYSNPSVGSYVVWVYKDGTHHDAVNNAFNNFEIEYDETAQKFEIEAAPLTYYIKAIEKEYTGEAQDIAFEVVTEGFQGKDKWTEIARTDQDKVVAPKIVLAEEGIIRNAGVYELLDENDGNVTAGPNYEVTYDKEKNGELTITPGTIKITGPSVDPIEFGAPLPTEEEFAALVADPNKTVINNVPYYANDRLALRQVIELVIEDEAALRGESGKYDVVVKLKSYEDLTDENKATLAGYGYEGENAVTTLLNNYGYGLVDEETGVANFIIKNGTLTIGNVDMTLVLDGDAEGTTLIDQLSEYNGATVNKIQIQNMKNFVTSSGDVSQKIFADRWYTLILPFDIKVRDLSPLFGYAIVNVPDKTKGSEGAAYFKLEMGTVPANTLMAFKVDENIEWTADKVVEFEAEEGTKIFAPTGEWTTDAAGNQFIGVYETQRIKGELNYVLWPLDGKFYNVAKTWGDAGLEIHPLNGYVHFNAPEAAAGARIYMEELDGSTTAINAVTGETISNNAEGWYSIDGMKLNAQPTQKGVYINNGKKVVIK